MIIDVDINNCFPQILRNIFCDVLGADVASFGFRFLCVYVKNLKSGRSFLAEYFAVSIMQVKKMLNCILNLCLPRSNLTLLWNLAVDVRRALSVVLEQTKFSYLGSMFSDRQCPMASPFRHQQTCRDGGRLMQKPMD